MNSAMTTLDTICPDCNAEVGEWCRQYEWVRDYWLGISEYKQTGVRAGHTLTHSSRKKKGN